MCFCLCSIIKFSKLCILFKTTVVYMLLTTLKTNNNKISMAKKDTEKTRVNAIKMNNYVPHIQLV